MAEVTGPISSLPGARHSVPMDAVCDTHPERKAVARIQGETDSFGAELWDVCEECLSEVRQDQRKARLGVCDWCKCEATTLKPHRDFEEGSRGRVYEVCMECRDNEAARLFHEWDDWTDG